MGSSGPSRHILASLVCAAFTTVAASAAAPLIEGLPVEGQPTRVAPFVPVGKALVMPVAVSDPDGDPVRISVSSSNPDVMVRVKTGNPLLKFRIEHAGDGSAADPAYSGDLVFQLFRDLTPETVSFIGGFAQGGYYDNVIFHRLSDLHGSQNPATQSFIFQSGDPQGTGSGGPGFSFENEFAAPLIFAGRGQLAMANAGYDNNYNATNGSQFFITDGSFGYDLQGNRTEGRPRHLDFGHTIFGQLTHGWELLDRLRATPRGTSDKPLSDVKIVSAGVVPSYEISDSNGTRQSIGAVLMITATSPGSAKITVRVDDRKGGVTVQRFKVKAEADYVNSPPFLSKLADQVAAKGGSVDLPFRVFDLEYDYVSLAHEILNKGSESAPNGTTSLLDGPILRVLGGANYEGPLSLVVAGEQFDMKDVGRNGFDDYQTSTIAVGESALTLNKAFLEGEPGVQLANVPVATFQRGDVSGLTATINWGDGTPVSTGTISPVAGGGFQVLGTHTFARPGSYTVSVTISSAKGLKAVAKSAAAISSTGLRAFGQVLSTVGRSISNQVVATFRDPAGAGSEADYSAVIDWGDGFFSKGKVKTFGTGAFNVLGSHAYRDSEKYPVAVRIQKSGNAPGAEAVAWSTVQASGFASKPHLPPFAQAHLIGQFSAVPNNPANAAAGNKNVRTTVDLPDGSKQTYLTVSALVLNSGSKKSPQSKLRFYLSKDNTLNTKASVATDGTQIPADLPIKFGGFKEALIPALKSQKSVSLICDKIEQGDFRLVLPKNNDGSGYYLLGALIYSDKVGDHMPIDRELIAGPF